MCTYSTGFGKCWYNNLYQYLILGTVNIILLIRTYITFSSLCYSLWQFRTEWLIDSFFVFVGFSPCRSYRRYFYLDKATGESQWDYPKVQEQLGSHEESGDVEIEESEMKVNGATEENKESDASSSSPKSETQKDSLSNNRSDDSRSPSRHRHRSRRYHKKHRKRRVRKLNLLLQLRF